MSPCPYHPVTVCVPRNRQMLYELLTGPSIGAAMPDEIICIDGRGSAATKRNIAAVQASQTYLFFCDDDVILEPNIFMRLVVELRTSGCAFAYCDYLTANHPLRGASYYKSQRWDVERLRQENYISAMSLVRRDAFEVVGGFDESIQRFQDWDLWLTMAEHGYSGHYVPEALFTAIYPPGPNMSTVDGIREAMAVVKRKHGIA